jgi:hypothetical protein
VLVIHKAYSMFNPFDTPRNLTREQWRARAHAIQSELAGLSIDELLRGGRRGAPRLDPNNQRRGGYDPNQPRVPEGHRDGGQWTDDERWTSGRWLRERWARLRGGLQFAATERPPLNPRGVPLYLARKLIEAIHRELASWDLFEAHNPDKVTVAVTTIDGREFHGTSSKFGDWRAIDYVEVRKLRALILRRYPHLAQGRGISEIPHDAFYHAETNLLLRAARENGGSLAGRSLDVFVDNETCWSCEQILGRVGLELGNPTVTFINTKSGRVMGTVRDGRWHPQ